VTLDQVVLGALEEESPAQLGGNNSGSGSDEEECAHPDSPCARTMHVYCSSVWIYSYLIDRFATEVTLVSTGAAAIFRFSYIKLLSCGVKESS